MNLLPAARGSYSLSGRIRTRRGRGHARDGRMRQRDLGLSRDSGPGLSALGTAARGGAGGNAKGLASLPEKPPAIDWAYYKTAVAKAGMVDDFQKKFSALKIPEPVDTQTAKVDAQEKESAKTSAEYVQASKARIAQYEQELQKLRSMIPFELMTYEDLHEAFPETRLDKEKHPYWPHKPIADL
ncbi:PREDICTED: ATP synthase subunit d, mitochondrial [Tinamus guttatus]|uniref:ATP synthase subunit d, mitochondrial n=1 Tax=Tinamus guttatus TaxID=94827 RepID=UPI00052EB53E|nr:PREDICTED: ATP synthase subunit d, mitochondrial [Tinamus guttatus]